MKIGIIGTGRMGFAQARLAQYFGDQIAWGIDPDDTARIRFETAFQVKCSHTVEEVDFENLDIIWITVTDGAIAQAAEQISDKLDPKTVLLHTSGALSSRIMSEHTTNPCASYHPLSPCPLFDITNDECLAHYRGVLHAAEGAPQALKLTEILAKRIEAPCVHIQPENKTLYHAAAVFASNYPVILIDIAMNLFQTVGFSQEDAFKSAKSLCSQSLHLLDNALPAQALTGPVKRNDQTTLSAHENALSEHPEYLATYQNLKNAAFQMLTREFSARKDKN